MSMGTVEYDDDFDYFGLAFVNIMTGVFFDKKCGKLIYKTSSNIGDQALLNKHYKYWICSSKWSIRHSYPTPNSVFVVFFVRHVKSLFYI